MQNVSVTMGIVLGILTVAIWLGGAVWFLSDLHNQWKANTNSINAITARLSNIDAHLEENKLSNQWFKNALCEHYEGSRRNKAKPAINGCNQD